ncbi:MAG: inositol monophosphatase family protein, partial [Polyangia bacterium]
MNELVIARRIAGEAAAILREGAGRRHESDQKRTSVDLVTEYDRRSEAHVVAALRAAFPDDEVVAEEGGGQPGTSGRRWLVDPLDGTTNFSHGLPFFCVSIAVEDARGPLAGVVDAPALGWQFF